MRRPTVAISALAALVLTIAPAAADPGLSDARARAAALRQQVDELQTRAEVATERYNAVQARLARAVVQHGLSEQALDDARAQASAGATVLEDRVRALYMSGGSAALLAAVLDGSGPADLVGRYRAVSSLVEFDRGTLADADRGVAAAAAAAARLGRTAAEVTRLQVAAARATDEVTTLLDRQQQLLAGAAAEVQRLAEAERAAREAASERAFAAALAAARAQAGGVADLPGATTPPTAAAAAAITAATSRLGRPYVWGATGPDTFDCSGLTQWAFRAAGVALPRVAADQWGAGPHPTLAELAPGDLLFWATNPSDWTSASTTSLSTSAPGMMIAAPHTGDVVKIQPVYLHEFFGATRVTGPAAPSASPQKG